MFDVSDGRIEKLELSKKLDSLDLLFSNSFSLYKLEGGKNSVLVLVFSSPIDGFSIGVTATLPINVFAQKELLHF